MKMHECSHRTCHELIPMSERYCKTHYKDDTARLRDRQRKYTDKQYNELKRDNIANEFYHSRQWNAVRNGVVARDCYMSGVTGKVLNDHDIIVDHIVRRDLCDNPLDTSNLWCLSRKEHNRKTKLEQIILSKPNGKSKLRHLSRGWWKKVLNEKKR